MRKIEIAKGHGKEVLCLPEENITAILEAQTAPALTDPEAAVRGVLRNPAGTEPLLDLLRERSPESVAIVVNDVTRPTPYKVMLPPILEILAEAGIEDRRITLVIATGIHRPNTPEENEAIFGRAVVERYRLISHDPDHDLRNCGTLSDGQRLDLCKWVADADFIINTGLITLHYFAGFSGGRKSTLPGVASRTMIEYNHSRMNEPGCRSGSIAGNPVHRTMLEAARKVGVDFIVNVLTDSRKAVTAVVAGDVEEAWLAGTEICGSQSTVRIPAKADVVIAGAGGYPKDINLYQAQKGLEHAAQAVKSGGTIVMAASCSEGYGEETFKRWMDQADSWQDLFDHFERGFELGGHKAFALARAVHDKRVIWVSDMDSAMLGNILMDSAASLEEALDMVRERHGEDFKAYVIPSAASVLPVMVR